MLINRNRIKNPYLKVFIDKFHIADGTEIPTYKYMFWIDKKHDDYRTLHHLPDHIELNPAQVDDFINYIAIEPE